MRYNALLRDHLPIGRLDRLIILQDSTDATDSYGTPTEAYSGTTKRWAYREVLSGRELYEARQINAAITTQFIIRYDENVTPKKQLVDLSVSPAINYDIHHAGEMKTDSGRYRYTEILASARNE